MKPAAIPAPVQAFAPDFSRRLGVILATLGALIARRFLREPRFAALIVPLWTRLRRAARRCERLMVGLAAGRLPKPHKSNAPSSASSGRAGPHRTVAAFPTSRGWLVAALGPEAAACALQLEALLAEPTTAGLLALAPSARCLLRPIARMLAVGAFAPRRARRPRSAPGTAPPGDPPPLGEIAIRSPGFTWYVVPTPPSAPA